MPTYEYECKVCQTHFEKFLHFTDDRDHVTCPLGHSETRRLLAHPGIVFKGSGFYVTDHRKSATPAAKTS